MGGFVLHEQYTGFHQSTCSWMVQLKFYKLGIALTNSTRDLITCGVYDHLASRNPNQTKQSVIAYFT